MKILSFLGFVLGVSLIAYGAMQTTSDITALINLPGLIIVIGGCITALFLSFPFDEIKQLMGLFKAFSDDSKINSKAAIRELVEVSKLWLRHDIKEIENHIEQVDNNFLRTGLQLVVDNCPLADTLDVMNWRITRLKARESAQAQIFRALSAYAPAFGMVGTLVGLINMMQYIDTNDFAKISLSMAVALLTTLYGLLLANLIFKPIAIKLERRTERRVVIMSMVLEGISLINQNRSPSFVKETLDSFAAHYENELYQPKSKAKKTSKKPVKPVKK